MRRLFPVILIIAALGPIARASALETSSWNGVWTGGVDDRVKISVTIADGKVARYAYMGASVPVQYDKVSSNSVSFGDRSHYSMSLVRSGDATARAIYHGQHGVFTIVLKKN